MEQAASPPKPSARLVAKPTIYYQTPNHQPVLAELLPTVRQLTTDEQPWSRDFVIKGDWQPLKGCWFIEEGKPTSLVVLTNREGRFTQTIPTAEQRQLAEVLVVLVMLAPPKEIAQVCDSFSCEAEHFTQVPHQPLLLPPGGLLIIEPTSLKDLRLRCPFGEARVTAWVYPG